MPAANTGQSHLMPGRLLETIAVSTLKQVEQVYAREPYFSGPIPAVKDDLIWFVNWQDKLVNNRREKHDLKRLSQKWNS